MLSIDLVNAIKAISQHIEKKKNADPELISMFMALNQDIMGLINENAALMAQVQELKDKVSLQDDIRYDEETEAYWRGKSDGPICQKCYDKDKFVIRLRTYDDTLWVCTTCDSQYFKPGGREVYIKRREQRDLEQKRRNEEVLRQNPYRRSLY